MGTIPNQKVERAIDTTYPSDPFAYSRLGDWMLWRQLEDQDLSRTYRLVSGPYGDCHFVMFFELPNGWFQPFQLV